MLKKVIFVLANLVYYFIVVFLVNLIGAYVLGQYLGYYRNRFIILSVTILFLLIPLLVMMIRNKKINSAVFIQFIVTIVLIITLFFLKL